MGAGHGAGTHLTRLKAHNSIQHHSGAGVVTAIAPPATTANSFARLWALGPEERAEAMYAGELSLNECSAWARRHPDQIPTLNGEFWFIAIKTPEVADHDS